MPKWCLSFMGHLVGLLLEFQEQMLKYESDKTNENSKSVKIKSSLQVIEGKHNQNVLLNWVFLKLKIEKKNSCGTFQNMFQTRHTLYL